MYDVQKVLDTYSTWISDKYQISKSRYDKIEMRQPVYTRLKAAYKFILQNNALNLQWGELPNGTKNLYRVIIHLNYNTEIMDRGRTIIQNGLGYYSLIIPWVPEFEIPLRNPQEDVLRLVQNGTPVYSVNTHKLQQTNPIKMKLKYVKAFNTTKK